MMFWVVDFKLKVADGCGPNHEIQGRPGVKENDPEPCLEFFFEGPQGAAQLLGSLQRCTIASLWIQAQANIREPETYCPCVLPPS
jgi:hypothetical protein